MTHSRNGRIVILMFAARSRSHPLRSLSGIFRGFPRKVSNRYTSFRPSFLRGPLLNMSGTVLHLRAEDKFLEHR